MIQRMSTLHKPHVKRFHAANFAPTKKTDTTIQRRGLAFALQCSPSRKKAAGFGASYAHLSLEIHHVDGAHAVAEERARQIVGKLRDNGPLCHFLFSEAFFIEFLHCLY